jgi:hypothetical protein
MSTQEHKMQDILPDRPYGSYSYKAERAEQVQKEIEKEDQHLSALELTKLKQKEKARQLADEKRVEAHGIVDARVKEEMVNRKKTIDTLDKIQHSVPDVIIPENAASAKSTTRKDVLRLLTSLNINMNLQLSKSDMYNLLACLMTANEKQLEILSQNGKIPIAIKIVIKRLQQDVKDGNMSTLERLWDRIYGSQPMITNLPDGANSVFSKSGILPNQPISREAYVEIRKIYYNE